MSNRRQLIDITINPAVGYPFGPNSSNPPAGRRHVHAVRHRLEVMVDMRGWPAGRVVGVTA
jgi:hypothetical protein